MSRTLSRRLVRQCSPFCFVAGDRSSWIYYNDRTCREWILSSLDSYYKLFTSKLGKLHLGFTNGVVTYDLSFSSSQTEGTISKRMAEADGSMLRCSSGRHCHPLRYQNGRQSIAREAAQLRQRGLEAAGRYASPTCGIFGLLLRQ